MRIAEFIFSAIVAFAIVYVIIQSQKTKSEWLSSSSNGYEISFKTIPTALEDSALTIPVTISGPKDNTVKYWFRYAGPKHTESTRLYLYEKTPLVSINPDSGHFQANMPTGHRATKMLYYFELRDPVGRYLAGLNAGDEIPLETKAIGRVDGWIKYAYFITMFLAIFIITKGAAGAIRILNAKGQLSEIRTYFVLGLIFSVISAFILKTWYGFQLNGDAWQSVPFGADLGDNLQLVLMAYLMFLAVVSKIPGKTKYTAVIGYLGIFSFFILAGAYLLPLVLKSGDVPVAVISYSLLAVILILALLLSRKLKSA